MAQAETPSLTQAIADSSNLTALHPQIPSLDLLRSEGMTDQPQFYTRVLSSTTLTAQAAIAISVSIKEVSPFTVARLSNMSTPSREAWGSIIDLKVPMWRLAASAGASPKQQVWLSCLLARAMLHESRTSSVRASSHSIESMKVSNDRWVPIRTVLIAALPSPNTSELRSLTKNSRRVLSSSIERGSWCRIGLADTTRMYIWSVVHSFNYEKEIKIVKQRDRNRQTNKSI